MSEALTHDHFLNNDGEEETPRPGTPETTETAANKGGELPQPLPPQQPVSALTGLPLDTSNDSTLDTRPLPDTSSGSGDGAALDELLGPMSRLGMVQLSRRERREIARKEREAAAALQQPPLPPSKPPLPPPQDGGRGMSVASQPPSLMMEAGGQQPLLADNLILQPPMQTAVVSSLQHHSPLGSSPGSLNPHHLLNLSNPGGGVAAGGGGGVAGGSTMLSSGQSSWEAPSPGHTQLPYDYNASPPTHANLINRGGADEGMASQYGGSQPNPLVSSPLGAARSIGGVQSPGQNNMGLRSPGARQNAVSEGGNANANNNANGGGGVYRDLLNPPSRRGKKSDPYEMQMCHLDIEAVRQGIDKRTTLRVANIPNKLDQRQLLHLFEANHKGCINFFYLPVDFKNEVRTPYQLPLPPSRLPFSPRVPSFNSLPSSLTHHLTHTQQGNLGYCFVNFVDTMRIPPFLEEFTGYRWGNIRSEKVCEINFARLQGWSGLAELLNRFRLSPLSREDPRLQPLVIHPTLGHRVSFSQINAELLQRFGGRQATGAEFEVVAMEVASGDEQRILTSRHQVLYNRRQGNGGIRPPTAPPPASALSGINPRSTIQPGLSHSSAGLSALVASALPQHLLNNAGGGGAGGVSPQAAAQAAAQVFAAQQQQQHAPPSPQLAHPSSLLYSPLQQQNPTSLAAQSPHNPNSPASVQQQANILADAAATATAQANMLATAAGVLAGTAGTTTGGANPAAAAAAAALMGATNNAAAGWVSAGRMGGPPPPPPPPQAPNVSVQAQAAQALAMQQALAAHGMTLSPQQAASLAAVTAAQTSVNQYQPPPPPQAFSAAMAMAMNGVTPNASPPQAPPSLYQAQQQHQAQQQQAQSRLSAEQVVPMLAQQQAAAAQAQAQEHQRAQQLLELARVQQQLQQQLQQFQGPQGGQGPPPGPPQPPFPH